MDKKQIRAHYRQIRTNFSTQQVDAASAQICKQIADWPIFQQANAVMTYMAFGNEINLTGLLNQFPGKRWIIPRILNRPEARIFLYPYDPSRLVRHKFGMLEPDPSLPLVQPHELDLVLTPGLVFDRHGYRLGFGGGFYDRFLPSVHAPKTGIVYSAFIIEAVPVEEFDQPVDYLACENGILKVSSS